MQQLEVGAILEGKVVKITNFGAFIELPDRRNGMVHISEISTSYVNDIAEYLTVGQVVKVKVINIAPDGKISLSIKRTMENGDAPRRTGGPRPGGARPSGPRPGGDRRSGAPRSGGRAQEATPSNPFEDMLQQFKKSSDDRMSDLKKFDVKRGSANRRSQHR